MDTKMVDTLIHIDENLTQNDLDNIRTTMLQQNGVMAAAYHDDKPHLMTVEYNPDVTNSMALLELVKQKGVHAELIGL